MKAAGEPSGSTSSRAPRIVDHGLDLAAMAHDAIVFEQTLDVAPRETRDPVEIEIKKCRAKIVALARMVRQLSPD